MARRTKSKKSTTITEVVEVVAQPEEIVAVVEVEKEIPVLMEASASDTLIVADSTEEAVMSPLEKIIPRLKEEISKIDKNFNIVYSKDMPGLIRIMDKTGLYCFARVKTGRDFLLGDFLAFLPAETIRCIAAVFLKLNIANKNGSYLAKNGLL